jgi:hypothetical protein
LLLSGFGEEEEKLLIDFLVLFDEEEDWKAPGCPEAFTVRNNMVESKKVADDGHATLKVRFI